MPRTLERLRCSACECGPVKRGQRSRERIVDGNVANPHAYPWQISIFSNIRGFAIYLKNLAEQNNIVLPDDFQEKLTEATSQNMLTHGCGGSIISNYYVISAAHCLQEKLESVIKEFPEDILEMFLQLPHEMLFYNSQPEYVFIIVGEQNLPDKITTIEEIERNSNIRPVIHIKLHEKYDPSHPNIPYDFGLVKLASPLTFSASVAPVCLPDPASSSKYAGWTGTVSGWGATDPDGMNTSTVLKDLEVTVLSNEECLEKLRDATEDRARAQGVNETMINFLRSNASLLRY